MCVSHPRRRTRFLLGALSLLESRLEESVRRRREMDAFGAEWLALVGDYDRSDEWRADGHQSAAAAVARAGPAA